MEELTPPNIEASPNRLPNKADKRALGLLATEAINTKIDKKLEKEIERAKKAIRNAEAASRKEAHAVQRLEELIEREHQLTPDLIKTLIERAAETGEAAERLFELRHENKDDDSAVTQSSIVTATPAKANSNDELAKLLKVKLAELDQQQIQKPAKTLPQTDDNPSTNQNLTYQRAIFSGIIVTILLLAAILILSIKQQ